MQGNDSKLAAAFEKIVQRELADCVRVAHESDVIFDYTLRPEWRNRTYFVGTRLGKQVLASISEDITSLVKHLTDAPLRHHVKSCLCPAPDRASEFNFDTSDGRLTEPAEAQRVQLACDYAECFAKAHAKAGQRITAGKLRPVGNRMSTKTSEVGLTPWLRAQIDAYELIIDSIPLADHPPPEFFFPVADVGQSAGRGAVCIQGTIPSLATSSRIFAYSLQRPNCKRKYS